MTPGYWQRLLAAEQAPLRPDARLVTTISLTFEAYLEEMGYPLSPDQSAALDRMRTELAS